MCRKATRPLPVSLQLRLNSKSRGTLAKRGKRKAKYVRTYSYFSVLVLIPPLSARIALTLSTRRLTDCNFSPTACSLVFSDFQTSCGMPSLRPMFSDVTGVL